MAGHGSRSAGRVYCRHYTGRNSLYHDEHPPFRAAEAAANRDAMVAGAGAGLRRPAADRGRPGGAAQTGGRS